MGFFERLFGKKEVEKQVFSIEDAEIFLSKTFDEKFQSLKDGATKIYQEMQSSIPSIQASLGMLAKAEYNDPVDSVLLQNVTAHRKSFIQKMQVMAEQINRTMKNDFDSILGFSESISSSIAETDHSTVKDYAFLKELFEKEARSSIENFKAINNLSKDLENTVNGSKEIIFLIKNSQRELQPIKDGKNAIDQVEDDVKRLDTILSSMGSKYENVKEELDKFLNGEQWKQFNELLDEKKRIEEDMAGLKSDMLQDFSRIERPLKKLKNLVDNGIVKIGNAKLFEKYVDSAVDALIEEGNVETLTHILKAVQDKISDGKIELKDKEKALDEIQRLIDNKAFENFLGKYSSLANDLENLERKISEQKASSMKADMERRIRDLEKQIEVVKMEIEKSRKQAGKLRIFLNEKKDALEKSMSILANKKIVIGV